MFHKIKSVKAMPDYILMVSFVEGIQKTYNLKPLFNQLPVFQDLQHIKGLYEQVQVDPGGYGISWNDDLDIACDELWANGTPYITPFDNLISFSDATNLWGLNESTLRKAIVYGKLKEGTDVKKFGKQWVITLDSMRREYGDPKC